MAPPLMFSLGAFSERPTFRQEGERHRHRDPERQRNGDSESQSESQSDRATESDTKEQLKKCI